MCETPSVYPLCKRFLLSRVECKHDILLDQSCPAQWLGCTLVYTMESQNPLCTPVVALLNFLLTYFHAHAAALPGFSKHQAIHNSFFCFWLLSGAVTEVTLGRCGSVGQECTLVVCKEAGDARSGYGLIFLYGRNIFLNGRDAGKRPAK